ncbi:MAG TPA: glycosyl hydrolase, partial [Draconibacterium sp.]|nr:glycosyl hydrolase [Draconibacterium sp.]
MKRNPIVLLLAVLLMGIVSQCHKSEPKTQVDLEQGFVNPPDEARPRVWWHWMNGNITKDGIEKDLNWMYRSGIRGFQNFDAAFMTPQIVENRLVYMTPEWKDAFSFTTKLADSLGLEMAIAGSPGWSESGGPWVPASEGMKKMVWTETVIEGGQAFSGVLPHPPTASGSFQNIGHTGGFSLGGAAPHVPEYYADAVVIAYKIPGADLSMKELNPKITSSGGKFNLEMLTDGDLVQSSLLPSAGEGQKSWIQFEFSQPQTIASVSMVGGGNVGQFGFGNSSEKRMLEASGDGKNFRNVVEIATGGVNQNTISFEPVSAKFFRVSIATPPTNNVSMSIPGLGDISAALGGNRGSQGTQIAEIVLNTVPRINHFEQKAGFAVVTKVEELQTPHTESENAIETTQVIDLTNNMAEDGTLNWTAPDGKWNVIRMGYSLTGHQNSPASPEATGLEVDKLNPDYVRKYFTNYLDQYKDATGGLMGENGLKYIVTDSWEAGVANWTDNMIEEFNKRNSYDIHP